MPDPSLMKHLILNTKKSKKVWTKIFVGKRCILNGGADEIRMNKEWWKFLFVHFVINILIFLFATTTKQETK